MNTNTKRYTFLFIDSRSRKYTFLIYSQFDWNQNLYIDKQTKFYYAKRNKRNKDFVSLFDRVKFYTLHTQNNIMRLPSSIGV